MSHRFALGALLLGVALGCSSESDQPVDGGAGKGGTGAAGSGGSHAGAAHAGAAGAGAAGEGGSRDDDTPAGAGGERNIAADTGEGGEGGEGGAAAVHFFTSATQHVDIKCFGFFAHRAEFRAGRAQLSSAQLDLLANATGVPGSTYDDNDDAIHCVVSTTDATHPLRQFVIDQGSDLISDEPLGGEGGAGGVPDLGPRPTVLGCEFHSEFGDGAPLEPRAAFAANPLCVRELDADGKVSTFSFNLAQADTPYHFEFADCAGQSLGQVKVELYGTDPATPLAVGSAPAAPGPDQACLVLDAQVAAPVVGRLVITSPTTPYDSVNYVIFH